MFKSNKKRGDMGSGTGSKANIHVLDYILKEIVHLKIKFISVENQDT